MKTINTATDTYLVTFKNSIQSQFICNWEDLAEPLNLLNQAYYLDHIYRFIPHKRKFEKVPLKDYNLLFGQNTEVIQLLEKFGYVK